MWTSPFGLHAVSNEQEKAPKFRRSVRLNSVSFNETWGIGGEQDRVFFLNIPRTNSSIVFNTIEKCDKRERFTRRSEVIGLLKIMSKEARFGLFTISQVPSAQC